MFGVVWDYYSSKLKGKQNKQITSSKSYKTDIRILANPGLAKSGFEQPGPGEKPSQQRENQHIIQPTYGNGSESNPGYIGGTRALSSLCHSC